MKKIIWTLIINLTISLTSCSSIDSLSSNRIDEGEIYYVNSIVDQETLQAYDGDIFMKNDEGRLNLCEGDTIHFLIGKTLQRYEVHGNVFLSRSVEYILFNQSFEGVLTMIHNSTNKDVRFIFELSNGELELIANPEQRLCHY